MVVARSKWACYSSHFKQAISDEEGPPALANVADESQHHPRLLVHSPLLHLG